MGHEQNPLKHFIPIFALNKNETIHLNDLND